MGHLALPPEGRQADVLRLVCGGPCARAMVAVAQPGRITHIRGGEHARHTALCARGDGAARGAGAGSFSAVADVSRREGKLNPLSELLLADPFGRMDVPGDPTVAGEVIVSSE